MFTISRATRASGAGGGCRFVPAFEALEPRYQPAAPAPATAPPADPAVAGSYAPETLDDAPPRIINFAAEEVSAGLFVITGQVIDDNPGGLIVTFGGNVAAVAGRTAEVQDDGTFEIVVQLNTNGTDGGWVTATTVDEVGQTSNTPAIFIMPTS
jgi:hypothetical protein